MDYRVLVDIAHPTAMLSLFMSPYLTKSKKAKGRNFLSLSFAFFQD
jgi:hypothetical protein